MSKRGISRNDTKEIFLIISSFVIGSLITLGIVMFTPTFSNLKGSNYVVTKNESQVYEKTSLAASLEKIYDAVVVVQGYTGDNLDSEGTGFVYKVDSKYGYLLTNEHVITGANKINVVFSNDEVVEAKLLGKDEYLDLAVLRVDKKYVTLVASIGNSENMKLGDTIFTVGSPLGYEYRGSVTSGVLSGKDRLVTTTISSSPNNDWIMKVLQIDASINPGNSGGPLLNVNGEVIGVCSLKLVDDDVEGMGFAIPIEYAMSHIDSLEKGKKIEWPVLGISMVNATDKQILASYNIELKDNIKEGAVIIDIKNSTSAQKAGLKKGDVVIKINGNRVKNTAFLRYELYQHQSGDIIEVTYIRNNKENTIKVKLSSSD